MQRIGKHYKHEAIIRRDYPTTDSAELAEKLQITQRALQQLAYKLDVKKCPTFKRKKRSDLMKKAHAGGLYRNSKGYISGITNKRIRELEDNIKTLSASGELVLANVTKMIIERIKASKSKNLDCLTIMDGR